MTQKRWWVLCLAVLLALGLTACQGESREEGLVVEVQTDEDGDLTAFVLEDSQGTRTGVMLAEKTRYWPRGEGSWTDEEELRAVMREELRADAWAYAYCHPRREKLKTADGETVPAYWATSVMVQGELKREAAALRDGTPVDVLELDSWRARRYRLADGTELLKVYEPWGPENCQVGDLESFDDLSEAAQEKVRRYYEDRDPLYDEMDVLEQCYAAWKELGEAYQKVHISQNVTPSASSERVMYFTTELLRPRYGTSLSSHVSFQDAFDRQTGERLDTWDLFALPEAEIRERLPELIDWEVDPAVRTEMKKTLKPEWIQFTRDGLQVNYLAGTLLGEEDDYIVFVRAGDLPEGLVQPWAVPKSWGEETS